MRRGLTTIFLLVLAACGGDGGSDDVMNTSGTIVLTANTTYEVTEGAVANIMVHRIGDDSGMARVDYATSDGTAVAGMDYRGTSGTLVFADGVSGYQTISIPITDDNTPEVAETFTVTLSNVAGATLGEPSSATVNIVNAAATLPITDGNAQDITSTVLGSATKAVEPIDILDVIGLPVIVSAAPAQSAVVMGVSTDVIACDDGEASVTWDDADNNLVISTGDTFDVVFADCYVVDIETGFNGPVSLTNLIVTGDPFNHIVPWSLALTVVFDNLQHYGAHFRQIDGELDLDLRSEDNVVVDLSIAATRLLLHVNPFTGDVEELSDYVLDETLDLNALTQLVNTSGTYANTLLEGAVVFETLQDFEIMFDDNPSSGQLLISDSSSSVLVTVLDNINVQLEIDIDLDGIIDRTIVVTWTELDID